MGSKLVVKSLPLALRCLALRVLALVVQVNFLALDFDLTILDIHTSGRWPGTPEQLTQRIRPFFQALIPVAVAEGLWIPASLAPKS